MHNHRHLCETIAYGKTVLDPFVRRVIQRPYIGLNWPKVRSNYSTDWSHMHFCMG